MNVSSDDDDVTVAGKLFHTLYTHTELFYAPALGGIWNSAIRPSVCPVAQLPRL